MSKPTSRFAWGHGEAKCMPPEGKPKGKPKPHPVEAARTHVAKSKARPK